MPEQIPIRIIRPKRSFKQRLSFVYFVFLRSASFSILIGVIVAGLFSAGVYVFAVPPTSVYGPGDTLDPNCAPGSTNCTVTTPAVYSFGSNNFSGTGTFTTTGTITAATLLGGTGTTSDLNLKTTSGVGATGADMHFLVGNNGATEAMTILNSGSVGIGTTAPQSLLDVQGPVGTGTATAGILTLATKELTIVDGDELGRINFNAPLESDGSDAILAGAAIWAEADDTFSTTVNSTELVFGTATTSAAVERMRIDSAGYVGIGTNSPLTQLHILGSEPDVLSQAFSDNDFVSEWAIERARGTSSVPLIVQDGDTIGQFSFNVYDGNSRELSASIRAEVDGTPGDEDVPGRLIFKTTPDGSSTLAERMRITNAGLVGIGTTAPGKALEINSATGANFRLTYNDSDGTAANYADFATTSTGDLAITASGGDIDFSNENLVTTGTIGGGAITGTSIIKSGGTSSQFLKADGSVDSSTYLTSVTAHNLLSATHGDTTASTVARGDLIVGIGAGATWDNLALGTIGKILRSDGTDLKYTTSTFADTYDVSTLLYASSANVVAGLATGNSGVLVTSGTGVPSIATDIPTAVTIGTAYIYRVGGTDVSLADGGTNASLTASNGGIFYSTATAGAILSGTATANQILMSGASTTPAWSTATYPATATTTGAYLRADGTNWISSTLVLPNAGTAYKLPVFSSTNTMTELVAVGATGEYLAGNTGAIPSWATLNQAAVAGLTTSSSPTFAGLTLSGLTTTRVLFSVDDAISDDADLTFATDTLTATKMVAPTSLTTPLIYGSTADNGDITIEGTSSATKTTSYVNLQTTGGSVGIGTTAPQSLLDVQGPVGTGTATAGILTLATKELTIVDGDELGRINFNAPLESDGSDAILAGAAIWAEADDTFSTTVNSTELVFGTATTSAAVERMRIDSAGYVGIGTSGPSANLTVSGAEAASGTVNIWADDGDDAADKIALSMSTGGVFSIQPGADSTTGIQILDTDGGTPIVNIDTTNEYVGIGTTSPTYLLSLSGQAAQTFWMERQTTAATAGNNLTVQSGGAKSGGTDLNGGGLYLSSGISTGSGSSDMFFQTATAGASATTDRTPSTKFTVRGSGNVVVGTGTALATNATSGFLYIPSSAGAQTGTPVLDTTGTAPIAYDTTNNRLYVYNPTGTPAWKYIAVTGGFQIPNYETIDPISAEGIKEGDIVLGMIDKTMDDNALHGVWVTWDSVKAELLAEARGELAKSTGAVGDGKVEGVETETFLGKIKNSLYSLGISAKDGAISIATLASKNFSALNAKIETADISKLQMKDEVTGETYCVTIKSGELVRAKGECGQIAIVATTGNPNDQIPNSNQPPSPNSQTTTQSGETRSPESSNASSVEIGSLNTSAQEIIQQAQQAANNALESSEHAQQAVQEQVENVVQQAAETADKAAKDVVKEMKEEIKEEIKEEVKREIKDEIASPSPDGSARNDGNIDDSSLREPAATSADVGGDEAISNQNEQPAEAQPEESPLQEIIPPVGDLIEQATSSFLNGVWNFIKYFWVKSYTSVSKIVPLKFEETKYFTAGLLQPLKKIFSPW